MTVAWTYSAAGEYSERLEWLTDVMQAPTGPEQRRRLREAPRTVLTADSLEDAAERRRLETALVGNGAGNWYAPLVADGSVLDAAWTVGHPENVLAVDTVDRRFSVDGRVLLIAPGGPSTVYDLGVVAALTSSSIELVDAPAHTWPAGTRVVPMVAAKLINVPSLSRFTADSAPLQVAFRVTEPLDATEDAGDVTYRGEPVLTLRPDWSVDPEFEASRALGIVDGATGPVTEYDQPGIPVTRMRVQFTLVGRAAITSFRSLLYALAGRWAAIWVPTWAHDFRLAAAVDAADTTLDVEAVGVDDWDLLPNRRDLRIELSSGTVLYRRITATEDLGGGVERLTIDSALGVDVAPSEALMISFLMLMRQDADVNLLRYWTAEVVQSEITFRGFRDDDV